MGLNGEVNLDKLYRVYDAIKKTPSFEHLRANDNPFVPGEGGNPIAFIIGEAPGAQEIIKRRPFVGPAGKVQRELMRSVGLAASPTDFAYLRDSVGINCWLTNVLHYRPPYRSPGNRKPNSLEIKAARPYLHAEWLAVGAPKLVIPVGTVALEAITGKRISITRVAGKYMPYKALNGSLLHLWPMIHPSYGLRNPAIINLIELDWTLLDRWLKAHDICSS